MTMGLLDSSVLIDCLRGHPSATELLNRQSAIAKPSTHLCVAAEVTAGARNKAELLVIDSFLDGFDIALPTQSDGAMALAWYRQFRLSHGVDWPDCQIAATALRLDVEVRTLNVKHFIAFPGIRVVRAY